jgi:hypothetical protein
MIDDTYSLWSYINDVSDKHFDLHIVLVCCLNRHINVDGGSTSLYVYRAIAEGAFRVLRSCTSGSENHSEPNSGLRRFREHVM